MKIDNIYIRDFRNLAEIELMPAEKLNIFIGANAQGKTNLLEAIQVLAGGVSFRRAIDRDLLRYGAAAYSLKADYSLKGRRLETILKYSPESGKQIVLNRKKVSMSHPDRLRTVSFIPDDLFLVKGSPERRRQFMDILLRQISAEYSYYLDNYQKSLRARNDFLKLDQPDTKKQAIIDEVFVEYGSFVILKRIQLVNILNDYIQDFFQNEEKKKHELRLKYAVSLRMEHDRVNLETITAAFLASIEQLRQEEWRRRRSLAGPHLDDLNIYLDDRNAGLYASQGQQRSIVIGLKLSELYSIQRISGSYPLFLLDEMLAELDEARRAEWLERLAKAPFQSFLTSVNAMPFTAATPGRVWQVRAGQIKIVGGKE